MRRETTCLVVVSLRLFVYGGLTPTATYFDVYLSPSDKIMTEKRTNNREFSTYTLLLLSLLSVTIR